MKLASCKTALTPPVVCSTDRSKAVVPVLVLLFVALRFILRGDLLGLTLCHFDLLCFSVLLALRLPRLGKVLFVRLFGLCLFGFPLPLVVWEGLQLVIVALPGLFSYLFCRFLFPLGVWEGLWFVIVTLPGLFSCLFLYVAFLLPSCAALLSFFWCLEKALYLDCGIF